MPFCRQKTRTQILCPWDISTAISPMAGISEKRVKVIVGTSRKSRKIGQHRITKTTQNQLCPNQRSQVTKMRHQNMPVHCQGMHRADVPAVNRFEGTSSSKKVPQDHKIVRKMIRKRTDDQYEVSAIFTMRLENLCKCGSRIFQIEIMGAFFGVSLNLLRSGIRCYGKRC